MRARIVPVVLAVWLLVALAACTEAPTVTRLPGVSVSTPAAPPTVETTADLRALKQRAGIPDCPESDPDDLRRSPAACPMSWSRASAAGERSGSPVSGASR